MLFGFGILNLFSGELSEEEEEDLVETILLLMNDFILNYMIKKMSSEGSQPFIDYYDNHGIVPVSQDISVFEQFLFRRNHLYRTYLRSNLPLAA
jgi:hypothetical protein